VITLIVYAFQDGIVYERKKLTVDHVNFNLIDFIFGVIGQYPSSLALINGAKSNVLYIIFIIYKILCMIRLFRQV